jgi:hypothetical protein
MQLHTCCGLGRQKYLTAVFIFGNKLKELKAKGEN